MMLPLGILVGYHLVESKEDQIPVPRHQLHTQAAGSGERWESPDQRNTGFGVVIPFERVFDMVESENVKLSLQAGLALAKAKAAFQPLDYRQYQTPEATD